MDINSRTSPGMHEVLFVILAVLAGCGGGGGAPPVPSQGSQIIQNPGETSPPNAASSVKIYATNVRNNTINVYDEDGKQFANCPFAHLVSPSGIAFDSHLERLYVVNGASPSVRAYDLQGNGIKTAGIFPDAGPAITFDSNNNHLYTADSVGLTPVKVYDEEGNPVTVSGTFPNATSIFGITFDRFNHQLYAVNETAGPEVVSYDEQGNQVALPNEPLGGYGCGPYVAITFDTHNRLFYIASNSESGPCAVPGVSALDESGKPVATTGTFMNADESVVAIAFNPHNKRLYTESVGGAVTVYDEEGNQIKTSGSFPGADGSGLVAAPQ